MRDQEEQQLPLNNQRRGAGTEKGESEESPRRLGEALNSLKPPNFTENKLRRRGVKPVKLKKNQNEPLN